MIIIRKNIGFFMKKIDHQFLFYISGALINPEHYTEETWNQHYQWGLEHPDVIGPPTIPWPY